MFDIKGDAIEAGDHVVFGLANSGLRMTLGYISRVLKKTVEIRYHFVNDYGQVREGNAIRRPHELVKIPPKVNPNDDPS